MGKIYEFLLKDENLSYNGLNSEKKVYVYTPDCYGLLKIKDYPVIYSFDAQNLLCDQDNYKCEAKDSVKLDEICRDKNYPAVIVGICNNEGEMVRNRQLTLSSDFGPLVSESLEAGYKLGTLEKTEQFVLNTLIPFVKSKFNVTSNPAETTIMGASSGGLASFYIGTKNPQIFGNVVALSPATPLYFTRDWEKHFKSIKVDKDQKVLIYCGYNKNDQLECMLYNALGKSQIFSADKIRKNLLKWGFKEENVKEVFDKDAYHNEFYWNKALSGTLDFII